MTSDVLGTIAALGALIEEETDQLGAGRSRATLGEISAAKARLVSALETQLAQKERATPGWLDRLAGEEREALRIAVGALRDLAEANGALLARQIDLSVDMLACITAETRRLSGGRSETYGEHGALSRLDLPAPIAINATL